MALLGVNWDITTGLTATSASVGSVAHGLGASGDAALAIITGSAVTAGTLVTIVDRNATRIRFRGGRAGVTFTAVIFRIWSAAR